MNIKEYAEPGTKDCESNCNREVIITPKDRIIVCHFCKRIIKKIKK
jgi:hypothetical protein